MLKNYNVAIELYNPKTYDIMELLIEAFGNYKNFNLDNIATYTLGIRKKKHKKPNYQLLRSGRIDLVKENLKQELKIIEHLYIRLKKGCILRFRTPSGLIEEHEVPFLSGYYPEEKKDLIEPYDMLFTGMRLQIKDVIEEEIKCMKCDNIWKIKSICYFGDTMLEKVHCPNCNEFMIEVRTNLMGPEISISHK